MIVVLHSLLAYLSAPTENPIRNEIVEVSVLDHLHFDHTRSTRQLSEVSFVYNMEFKSEQISSVQN